MTRRILHLDDDSGETALLRLLLDRIPGLVYELVHSNSADEGLAAVQRDDFESLFIDHSVGGVNADTLLPRIRETGFLQPVIVLTSQQDPVAAVHDTQSA